jgi:N-acetylglucosaminyl-diphospho-decaprenol L-rhamnosyltransferase
VIVSSALDVVIVSYRSRELLLQCLTALRAHPPQGEVRVWVVDNASGDGTPEMVRTGFPEVELVASRANLGFAAASNLAIRRGSAPYVLALNPDTRLTEGALDRLLAVMQEIPSIGVAGCRLERADGSFDHAARRAFPTVLGALGHFSGLGRRDRAPAGLSQYRAPSVDRGAVDAVNGAFMLMRRSALEEVGLFDEGYWMYMEDLDLCYRFAQNGWLTWYEPDVTVTHVKGGSSGASRSARLNYAFHYGMWRFYRKHYASAHNPVVNALVYVGIAVKLLLSLGRGALRRLRPTLSGPGRLGTSR